MSKIFVPTMLYDQAPRAFSPALAKVVGLNEAIIIQQIHYRLALRQHYIVSVEEGKEKGRYWFYRSYEKWQEKDFPWWDVQTVARSFRKMVKSKLIFQANFNQDPRDRTSWWSINYELIEKLADEVFGAEQEVAAEAESREPVSEEPANPHGCALVQVDTMQSSKVNNAKLQSDTMQSSDMNNATGQVDTMQQGNLTSCIYTKNLRTKKDLKDLVPAVGGTSEKSLKSTESGKKLSPLSSKSKVSDKSDAEELAEFIKDKLLELDAELQAQGKSGLRNIPDNEKKMGRWVNMCRLLLKKDRRPLAEAKELFAWANQDAFWQKNILSPHKFREQYDQLLLKRDEKRPRSKSVGDRKMSTEDWGWEV